MAPELGAVGFGASIGGYSAVENLTYNAAKGKTTASDSIEAIAGGLGEGLFAGIVHKASSKASGKASESTPAKPEPIKPMTEAELEKVSGGAKDPGWKPDIRDNIAHNSALFEKLKRQLAFEEVQSVVKTTEHGVQRLVTRGFTPSEIFEVKVLSDKVLLQADGAQVFIRNIGNGKFNVIVEGENGIVTALKNIGKKSLERLSKNYGWK